MTTVPTEPGTTVNETSTGSPQPSSYWPKTTTAATASYTTDTVTTVTTPPEQPTTVSMTTPAVSSFVDQGDHNIGLLKPGYLSSLYGFGLDLKLEAYKNLKFFVGFVLHSNCDPF